MCGVGHLLSPGLREESIGSVVAVRYDTELAREFDVEDEKNIIDMLADTSSELEFEFETIQVDVPFEGTTQKATYSPHYTGYVIKSPDQHYVAKKIH